MNLFSRVARFSVSTVAVTGVLAGAGLVLGPVADANFGRVAATTVVNVRQGPSTSTTSLGLLSRGQIVEQRGETANGWMPVRWNGRDAFVYAQYLTAAAAPAQAAPTGTATATDYLNVRQGASVFTRIYGVLKPGESVPVTGGSSNGWTPVTYQGKAAYVSTQYIRTTAAAAPAPAPAPAAPAEPAPAPAAPAPAAPAPAPATTPGFTTAPLNVRSGASLGSSVVTVLPNGTEVALTGERSNGFAQIVHRGALRWVHTDYLRVASSPAPAPAPTPPAPVAEPVAPAPAPLPAVIATRYTTDAVNVRTDPNLSSGVASVAMPGSAIKVTGTVQNGFAQVIYGDVVRWMSAQYLADSPSYNGGGSVGLGNMSASAKGIVATGRANWPAIVTYYGVRPNGGDHTAGRAVDLMIPSWRTNKALGTEVAEYFRANAAAHNIDYIIWDQHIWIASMPGRGWVLMGDRGSDTENHKDHVHISVKS